MSRAANPTVLPPSGHKAAAVEAMFDRIAPRYDALNRVITFGMDVRWRRTTVAALGLDAGSRVLDLACGTADLCRTLRAASYQPTGVDFAVEMLRAANTDAPLVRADALQLPFAAGSFDGVTCGFGLRNFVAVQPAVAECARVLRPGGRIALLEVAEPASPTVRALHGVWFRHVVPFVGGLLSDRAAYRYLPASLAYLPPLPDLFGMLSERDLIEVTHRPLGFGAAQLITGTRA